MKVGESGEYIWSQASARVLCTVDEHNFTARGKVILRPGYLWVPGRGGQPLCADCVVYVGRRRQRVTAARDT